MITAMKIMLCGRHGVTVFTHAFLVFLAAVTNYHRNMALSRVFSSTTV